MIWTRVLLRCLLVFLILPAALTINVAAASMPKVQPGVVQATIISYSQKSETMTWKSARRRWKADVPTTITIGVKLGSKSPLNAFKVGDHVVLLSSYKDFSLIEVITDRLSYAAFFHDRDFRGTVSQVRADTKAIMLSSQENSLLRPGVPRTDRTFFVTKHTQFWLNGQRRDPQEALNALRSGVALDIAVHNTDYHDVDRIPAYAVFDIQSWRAYAESELKSGRKLFRPSTPTPLRQTND